MRGRRLEVVQGADVAAHGYNGTREDWGSSPVETLPVNERYNYVFQGNSQTLDHILVGGRMKSVDYDIVHINAEFWDQASDHDPQVARIKPGK